MWNYKKAINATTHAMDVLASYSEEYKEHRAHLKELLRIQRERAAIHTTGLTDEKPHG